MKKLDILCYRWRHADITFPCLYIIGFTIEDQHWWNVKTHQLAIVPTEPKNITIHHTIFYCDLFSWFIFLAECTILNFADAGRCTCTVSLHGWPLVHCQLNGLQLPVMSIFVFKHFIPSIFNCLCIIWKHLAQTCCSITLTDSQTFYQRSVFGGKTHSLHSWKYDVSMTSLVTKNI